MECKHSSSSSNVVLLADDEPQIRNMLDYLLTSQGYIVIQAVDGQDALDKFSQYADEICLVVTDIAMPRMDGVASFREMSKRKPSAKVLFISGYPEQMPPNAEFLLKPFSPLEFLDAVRETLGRV